MAINNEVSDLDLIEIEKFFEKNNVHIKKGRAIDLCSGSIARCTRVLAKYSTKIDIIDFKPGWGKLKKSLQGDMIKDNLKFFVNHNKV